jgi:hypothetical protein
MNWIAPQLTGGIGNRLFQYAAAAGLAEKWGQPVVFFLPRCGPTDHGPFDTIFKLLPGVPKVDLANSWEVLTEPYRGMYTYYPFPEKRKVEGCFTIQGWRQSEKYFPSGGVILDFENALGPEKALQIRQQISDPYNTWFIHVRLGDYKVLPHHQVNLMSYYAKCIYQIPKGSTLILLSDEVKLCEEPISEMAKNNDLHFSICDSPDEVTALYVMSHCKGGAITANSTFSWWGAYSAHQGCSPLFKAFYPLNWGNGMPPPTDVVPTWGTGLDV